MHAWFVNEAVISVVLQPLSPILVKAGGEGAGSLDPTLPDMSFVRTRQRDGQVGDIFIPGSSFRGVLRSHAERLVRSLFPHQACDVLHHKAEEGATLPPRCVRKLEGIGKKDSEKKEGGAAVYRQSCYACRAFGNTMIASKVRVSDLYLVDADKAETAVRYGVAIDRVTGAVAHGPWEMEVLTRGSLQGTVQVRNFTLGQLGLVAASLLDMADGLVPIGLGKSRGLGRVRLEFPNITLRYLRQPPYPLAGVEDLIPADDAVLNGYPRPSSGKRAAVELPPAQRKGLFHVVQVSDGYKLLQECAPLWVTELEEEQR
ncbi:MAG: RAMP superfamily CRISPR-associated protein [Bacillota bacterium]|nr:RAMP superfamily CRISPR-associated protein [Bacillota bacterium]